MELRSTTKEFIEELQRHFGRSLAFPQEVGYLLDQANENGLVELFRDAIFQAKFATKTREVMTRIGPDGEGFDKLSTEFRTSIEKTSTLLKTIIKESPDEIKQRFVKDFFSLDQLRFAQFIKLLEDLSWVKNWEVDGKPLPVSGKDSTIAEPSRDKLRSGERASHRSREELVRIRNAASFGFILLMLLFLVDPPVTFLGWGLTIVVELFLLYIALASRAIAKKPQQSI